MKNIESALAEALQNKGDSVATEYEMYLIMREFFYKKEINGERILIKQKYPTTKRLRVAVKKLLSKGFLREDEDLGAGVYEIPSNPKQNSDEVCCLVDPFCYVSHLSAMQMHNITNRYSAELILTSPNRKIWYSMKRDKIRKDYSENTLNGDILDLLRVTFSPRVRGRGVTRHETMHPGHFRRVRGSRVRVSSIGQTFLDTVEKPQWCGGMEHVIDVWSEHASTYSEEIIESVEMAAKNISKIRAGYILQEHIGICLDDSRVNGWKILAQRGGSQVLDPTRPYAENFSETWMVSINV